LEAFENGAEGIRTPDLFDANEAVSFLLIRIEILLKPASLLSPIL